MREAKNFGKCRELRSWNKKIYIKHNIFEKVFTQQTKQNFGVRKHGKVHKNSLGKGLSTKFKMFVFDGDVRFPSLLPGVVLTGMVFDMC